MCVGVVVVVQEDSSTGDSVCCPMVDAAAVVCGFAYKVGAFGLCVDELVSGDRKWELGIDIPHCRNTGYQCDRTMDVLDRCTSGGFGFFGGNNHLHAGIHPTASRSACS